MLLRDFRKIRNISPGLAAAELGVTYVTYWRWEERKVTPSNGNIRRIRDWSKGAVTADDLQAEKAAA